MNIEIRYFASVREKLGIDRESVDLPAHVKTVGGVRQFLVSRGGVWSEALGEGQPLRMACEQQMTGPDTPVTEGCEVAFFPPVTGG